MTEVNPWMVLPFVLLLGAMVLAPLFGPDWWSRHYAKVSLGLGALSAAYYLFVLRKVDTCEHIAADYFSFIALIGSLYVVSGGIHISVKGEATPFVNVLFLLVGAIVANVLGTTGASMLLIRPWIRMNKYRITSHHIVFFIFIVANVGGSLTAVGDPPLFIGYLQGVPFWWITGRAWPIWLTGVAILLALFYVIDRRNFLRAPHAVREKETAHETWKFEGLANLCFLAVILGAIMVEHPKFLREALMIFAAVASYFTTRRSVHEANHFNFHPIREVAILFAGIFATMMPALDWLETHAHDLLGDHASPGVFFWGAGGLSSVLDNAPTYLAFLSALFGTTGAHNIHDLLAQHPLEILAISIGAVFFGGATYIGNGPNFMIKSVADHQHVHTPTFLGFVFSYSLPCLLPMLLVIWLLFFRG